MSKVTAVFVVVGIIFGVSILGFNIWGILGGIWIGIGAKILIEKLFRR